MLLNASHEITRCGLPDHVQNRYVRYKQGNRAIVAWMTKYGPEEYKGKKTLPIKKMVALGRHLCSKTNEIGTLPADIDFYFKDVICERAFLSNYFKQHKDRCEDDDVDTINHEHFTDSLKQIHKILLTAGKPQRVHHHHATNKRTQRSSDALDIRPRNLFQHIDSEEDSSDGEDVGVISDTETSATSECSHESEHRMTCECEDTEEAEDFLDDQGDLANAMEKAMLVQHMCSYLSQVQECWSEAGRQKCGIATATVFTSIVAKRLARLITDFETIIDDQSLSLSCEVLLERLQCHVDDDHALHSEQHETQADIFLKQLEAVLVGLSAKLAASTPSASTDAIKRTVPEESTHANLLTSLIECLPSSILNSTRSELVTLGVPGMRNLIKLDAGDERTISTALCFSQLLLMISHAAYSSALAQPKLLVLPRIASLKLANEALASIKLFIGDKSIFPCMCTNTLGYRVAEMQLQLERYAKYNCWNALMQSPYTAGNHILEILDLCSYYGMHLFHYRQYVAAVLHVYNALLELKAIEIIPALEQILDAFKPVLFTTGARPRNGFVATWLRYIGARLKFNKGKRSQNHKDTWCMSIPAHTAARSAGLNISDKDKTTALQPKFDYGTVDETMRLKHSDWCYEDFLAGDSINVATMQVPGFGGIFNNNSTSARHRRKRSSKSNVPNMPILSSRADNCTSCETATAPPPERDILEQSLQKFSKPFSRSTSNSESYLPTSKLNLLAIFNTLTRVVHTISDTTHAEDDSSSKPESISSPPPPPNNGKGQLCLCFVQTLLRGADRVMDTRKRHGLDAKGAVWTKLEKECTACFRDSLVVELALANVAKADEDGKFRNDGVGQGWLWGSI